MLYRHNLVTEIYPLHDWFSRRQPRINVANVYNDNLEPIASRDLF